MEVHNNTSKKQNELGEILRLFSIGFNKHQIREKLNLSKSNFSNYLSKLELSGNIKRIGKYEVKVLSSSLNHYKVTRTLIDKKLNKRGHAHNFNIVFEKPQDLWKNPVILNQIAESKAQRLKTGVIALNYKKYRVWINKSTLTVYSSNSYFSNSAIYSKFTALRDLDKFLVYFKDKYQIKGIYGIEIFREHYGLIFNKFAEWILSQGKKMEVKNKGNKSILWVDDSKDDDIGLKEFEGINPLDVNNADNFFESHERTGWKVTPEFILNAFAVSQNQLTQFSKQIESHLALIKQWKKSNEDWRKSEVKKIKSNILNGEQKTLDKYN